jgi:opacity protein-like surface antigen
MRGGASVTTGLAGAAAFAVMSALPVVAFAQSDNRPTLNLYGVTGLIDMPSAEAQPDGEMTFAVSNFAGQTRTTVGFQVFPWLSGSFRYSAISNWNSGGFDTYYDRSFDLRFRLAEEGAWHPWMPAVSVGLRDFLGTGLYSGEYVVATRHITDDLKVTAGLGWGRLGSYGDIGSTGTRDPIDVGRGGDVNAGQWFRGPFAPFGGIEWQPTDRLSLKIEYSSDAYALETDQRGLFDRRSPINFGASYQVNDLFSLDAYALYGSEFGIQANFAWNPNRPPNAGSIEAAPAPVARRPAPAADPSLWSTGWAAEPDAAARIIPVLEPWLARDGLEIEAFAVEATEATLWLRNGRYDTEVQAIGRAARALTRSLPASVETFHIIPVAAGLPVARITLQRSDIEALETALDGDTLILDRAVFSDAGPRPPRSAYRDNRYPRFFWGLEPDVELSFFDPDQPVRGDLNLDLWGRYEVAPGLVFSGAISKRLIGNLDQVERESNSVLPRVRSDFALYDREGDPGLSGLTAAWFFRPGQDLYGRVTFGYLEQMFGGLSTELLWKPVDSRLALGGEINYAMQRDFDMLFGFQDYDVVTGHLSAYYLFDGGYEAQVDAGRYLAGDWGTTLTLRREFRNGWRIGAFATFTDVSAEDFGEGSFDKGIELSIPLSWFIGRPTRRVASTVVRPLTRDGGQRLRVADRLYGQVRDYHLDRLYATSARFWR